MIPQYIPLIDRPSLADQINKYILSDGFFTEYRHTEEFERRIAEFLEVKHCVVVNNGTISLSLALLALGIRPGDRVLIPNITMIATCNAVRLIGAEPMIAEISSENCCLALEEAEKTIEDHCAIKAVIYVTLNGRSHTKKRLIDFESFCNKKNVAVIYDNAQSFGSFHPDGPPINCVGSVGSFSFSMPKIITTGQGGCLVTDSDHINKQIRKLKDFGRSSGGNDIHDSFGINAKFTEMQAIMGIQQMDSIHHRVNKKKWIYESYYKLMDGAIMYKISNSVPWFVDCYTSDRDDLVTYLADWGIKTRNVYPEISKQKCNSDLVPMIFKNSKCLAESGVWLPSSLSITIDEIEYVCSKIKEFING